MKKIEDINEARIRRLVKNAKKLGLDLNKVTVVKSNKKTWFDKALEKKTK